MASCLDSALRSVGSLTEEIKGLTVALHREQERHALAVAPVEELLKEPKPGPMKRLFTRNKRPGMSASVTRSPHIARSPNWPPSEPTRPIRLRSRPLTSPRARIASTRVSGLLFRPGKVREPQCIKVPRNRPARAACSLGRDASFCGV